MPEEGCIPFRGCPTKNKDNKLRKNIRKSWRKSVYFSVEQRNILRRPWYQSSNTKKWCTSGDRNGRLFFMVTGGMTKRNQLYRRKNDVTLEILGETGAVWCWGKMGDIVAFPLLEVNNMLGQAKYSWCFSKQEDELLHVSGSCALQCCTGAALHCVVY